MSAESDKLFCFIDSTRPCSAECVAYTTYPPEGDDYKEQKWAHCLVLTNLHRAGKHLVVLASVGSDLYKIRKTDIADRRRGL